MTIISNSCFRQNTRLTKLLISRSLTWWIQGLSRTCRIKFNDFQAPVLFSSTFKALNLGGKIQVLSRMRGNPVQLVDEFQWNLPQIFIMWVGIAEKVFKVRGQRSRSWPDQLTCIGRNIHFDGTAPRLAFLLHLQISDVNRCPDLYRWGWLTAVSCTLVINSAIRKARKTTGPI